MRKKLITFLMVCVLLVTVTACDKKEDKTENKVELTNVYSVKDNGSYNIVTSLKVTVNSDTYLEGNVASLKVGETTVTGSDVTDSVLVLDKTNTSLNSNESATIMYSFNLDEATYNSLKNATLTYSIGNNYEKMTNVISGTFTVAKDSIKDVEQQEDLIKAAYPNSSDDALMVASLEWKFEEIDTLLHRSLSTETETVKFQEDVGCVSEETTIKAEKLLDFFAEGKENSISITNVNGKLFDTTYEYTKYTLPSLNYDTIEKYYPGTKELLTELNETTNKYANGLKALTGEECYDEISLEDIRNIALEIESLMN